VKCNPPVKTHAMLKNRNLLTLAVTLCISLHSLSQDNDVITINPCENGFIRKQSDSLKNLFTQAGFIVLREAMVSMESQYELPIIVPMNEGTWYQVVFIGDMNSNTYEVRMYDYDENQVVYKKNRWGDVDGNIITYSYIPKMSEYHMIKPVQVNSKQKKNLCGYILLLKKVK
jgi:hypothetical protein